jgi:hypothetical protein
MANEVLQRLFTTGTTFIPVGFNTGLRFIGNRPIARRRHTQLPQNQSPPSGNSSKHRGNTSQNNKRQFLNNGKYLFGILSSQAVLNDLSSIQIIPLLQLVILSD